MKLTIFAFLLLLPVQSLWAQGQSDIERNVSALGLEVESVQASPVEGFYEVVTNEGLFYVSGDGQHFFAGQLFDIEGSVTNLTEIAQARMRNDKLATINDELIVFEAPEEKHRVIVFTDHTCGYCRSLHRNLDDYHNAGITVQYAAFPRTGMGTDSARELKSVWCSDDPQAALTAAKEGRPPKKQSCDIDIERHLVLGRQLGVSGTPAVILEDGRLLPGYRPAAQILNEINKGS